MYSEIFERAMVIVFKNEGGYVNHPNDPGGETKYGITKRTYPDLDIRNLTKEQAKEIYYRDWWSKYNYDKFDCEDLAIKIFDTAINMGARRAHRILQRCLQSNGFPEIVDDGRIGPRTLGAINRANCYDVLDCFRQGQAAYYRALVERNPRLGVFLRGWLRRAAE